jgi:hypothetical protein
MGGFAMLPGRLMLAQLEVTGCLQVVMRGGRVMGSGLVMVLGCRALPGGRHGPILRFTDQGRGAASSHEDIKVCPGPDGLRSGRRPAESWPTRREYDRRVIGTHFQARARALESRGQGGRRLRSSTTGMNIKKKADVEEHQEAFHHVGLLVNEPPGAAGLLFVQSSDEKAHFCFAEAGR